VPVADSTAGEFDALLRKERVAAAAPDDWGVKTMLNEAL